MLVGSTGGKTPKPPKKRSYTTVTDPKTGKPMKDKNGKVIKFYDKY